MVNVVYQTGIAFTEPPAFNIQLSETSTHYHLPRKKYATIWSTQDFLILKNKNYKKKKSEHNENADSIYGILLFSRIYVGFFELMELTIILAPFVHFSRHWKMLSTGIVTK